MRGKEVAKPVPAWVTKALFVVICLANVAVAQSPVSTWQTMDDGSGKPRSIVQIEERSGLLEGKVSQIFLQPCELPDPVCSKCSGERKNAKTVRWPHFFAVGKSGRVAAFAQKNSWKIPISKYFRANLDFV